MMSKKTRLELELENEYLLNRLVDIDELALKVSNLSRVFIRGNIQLQMKTYTKESLIVAVTTPHE